MPFASHALRAVGTIALAAMLSHCVLNRRSALRDAALDRVVCDEACQAQAQPDDCISTADYFRDYSWPEVFSRCVNCHKAGGESDGTRFVLKTPAVPNYLTLDMEIVDRASALQQDGVSLLMLKATNAVPHGGKTQLSPGGKGFAVLEETLKRLKEPIVCAHDLDNQVPAPRPVSEGVTLMSDYAALRKASFQIAGRPPTTAEVTQVDASGLAAFDAILNAQMTEPPFDERLREIFNDALLTDGFRSNNVYNTSSTMLNLTFFPDDAVDYDLDCPQPGGGPRCDWNWYSWEKGEGIKLTEALAREPLEFVVRAVRNDRPISDILTAKYRLLNAYSAKAMKVDYKTYAYSDTLDVSAIPGGEEFVEVAHVPGINEASGVGEYAGILTTSAFLQRYPTTSTNLNRKRSRFVYKHFLGYDIMKSAPRIDAAAVDLTDDPTFKNSQCTGCHAKIDPLAGAFMNQDECGFINANFYRPPTGHKEGPCANASGWVSSDHMFQPGVAAGDGNALATSERPQALEKLAAYVVAQDEFARAMVQHVYVGMMGRSLLNAPGDESVPGFANLDAAYEAEQQTLAELTTILKDAGLKLKPVFIAIAKSNAFRAGQADEANRVELSGQGGGTLTQVEVLDRKLTAITGVRWRPHLVDDEVRGNYIARYDNTAGAVLLNRAQFKTLYGGIDGTFDGVKVRGRLPSSLTAAIVENMALAVSCESVTRDFDKLAAQRKLFPLVDKGLVPSGSLAAADQAPIVENLRYLHQWILGERLAADAPEIAESYKLLVDARQALVTASPGAALERPCANDRVLATGDVVAGGTTTDPQYVIRAWQAVVAYMLMDYNFVFEP